MAHDLHTSLLDTNHKCSLDFPFDRPPITSFKQLIPAFWIESKKLWYLAGSAIFTSICQYSLGAITQTFAGHLSPLELAAVSIENTVIAGLAFGIMWGLGSALETICGQAFGAGQLHLLGIYMQRSWLILTSTALVMTLIYIFATPILKFLGQSDEIAELAGVFSIWMIPQLFAYALNFPMQKFLQSQSKVVVMAWISAISLIFHIFASWLCIIQLGWGLAGAAASLDLSWWIIVLGQLAYITMSGSCRESWTGFSREAFHNLAAFTRLSFASAVMLCMEFYYYMMLVLLAGHLKHPQIAVDSISICININGWETMIPIGFNAAISVRISNELGEGRPRTAKFSILVVVVTSLVVSVLFMAVHSDSQRRVCIALHKQPANNSRGYRPCNATCIHIAVKWHPVSSLRGGNRCGLAGSGSLCEHWMLLHRRVTSRVFSGLKAGHGSEGNLEWNDKRNGLTDCCSLLHCISNQLEPGGCQGHAPDPPLGRITRNYEQMWIPQGGK